MTTILMIDGALHADRRKVANHITGGMVGCFEETKIVTLPFCHYATSGFDFMDHTDDKKALQDQLATMFGIFDIILGKDSPSVILQEMIKIKELEPALTILVGTLEERFSDWCTERKMSIIAMGHSRNILAGAIRDNGIGRNSSVASIGAGRNMASILAFNKEPVDSIYNALREVHYPTGADVETVYASSIDKSLIAPISCYEFMVTMDQMVRGRNNSLKDQKDPCIKASVDALEIMLAVLLTFKKYDHKKNMVVADSVELMNDAVQEGSIYRVKARQLINFKG